jgi:hypothetical protein
MEFEQSEPVEWFVEDKATLAFEYVGSDLTLGPLRFDTCNGDI